MNCDGFKASLHEYFRGELPAQEVPAVDAHAAECAECGALMGRARELSCQDFTEFLNDYVDGDMAVERRSAFDRHLEICEDCRNYLQSYRAAMHQSILALGRGLDVLSKPVPEDLILAVMKAAKEGGGRP